MDEKLTQMLANVFNLNSNDVNLNIKRDDISKWDSLTHMDLITSIENTYNLQLEIDDILDLDSFQAVADLISRKGGN